MALCYRPLLNGGRLLDSDTEDTSVYLASIHVEAVRPLRGIDRVAYIIANVLPKAPDLEKAMLQKWITHIDFFAECLDDIAF